MKTQRDLSFFLFSPAFDRPWAIFRWTRARGSVFDISFWFFIVFLTVPRFALQVCSLGTLSGVSPARRALRASGVPSPSNAMRASHNDVSRCMVRVPNTSLGTYWQKVPQTTHIKMLLFNLSLRSISNLLFIDFLPVM